jgi:hypothetical protein
MPQNSFSKRHGYTGQPQEISIREDAPENLRYFVLETAHELGLGPSSIRNITCAVLEQRPDPSNWSEYPNVWDEAQGHVYGCQWFQVYDIIERVWKCLKARHDQPAFEEAINDFFIRNGIGWQLVNGEIVVRGTEVFEATVKQRKRHWRSRVVRRRQNIFMKRCRLFLGAQSRTCPVRCITPSVLLNALARDVTGDQKATLGEILKKHPDLVPRPLDTALSQIWGYGSNEAMKHAMFRKVGSLNRPRRSFWSGWLAQWRRISVKNSKGVSCHPLQFLFMRRFRNGSTTARALSFINS